jgi:NAD-dependent dihydropyrimidine dehydrogenase PreA subunit
MARGKINTLEYDPALCNRCGLCTIVCPHGVFEDGDVAVRLVDRDACMECGACRLNCEAGAIKVDSDVGCAYAMMRAALTRRGEATCGCG